MDYNMKECFGIIYGATNKINGKIYIGQTTKSLAERRYAHINSAKNHSSPYGILHKAIRKYGFDSFTWKIIARCDSKKELNEMEFHYIKQYSSHVPNGYNLTYGGEGVLGMKHTDKAKQRMSEKRSGSGNPMYNKSISKICGDKISLKLKKYYAENAGSFFGKKHTIASRQKMSVSRTGTGNHLYGKHLSKEHRRKIAEANRGRHFCKEWCKNISNAKKGKNLGSDNKRSKKYVLCFPDGSEFIVHGLANFCSKYNEVKLSQAHLSGVASGNRKHHKGYKCRYYNKETDSALSVWEDI